VTLATAHREFMVWPMTAAHLETIRKYGNKISQVGLFFFRINSDGTITDSLPANAYEVAQEWPHIRWLLTVRNDGFESIFRSLLTNQAAQDKFISEIHRLLDLYYWADGVDIDLEHGPNDLREQIYALYQRIYTEVKSRPGNPHVHLDLPPMEGPYLTVGPEKWCAYERLRDLADTVQIMTYNFAWSGSAPGSTTPVAWLRRVMTYATSAFDPNQVFMGVPAYGHRWQIYDYPVNLGRQYRGYGGAFEPFLDWMLGKLSHTDQYRGGAETQKYIPFAAFYETQDFHNIVYLHIYDYPGAGEEDSREYPTVAGQYDRPFLTCYSKTQRSDFIGKIIDRPASDTDEHSGALIIDETSGVVSPRKPSTTTDPNTGEPVTEEEGYAKWVLNIPSSGTYDVVLRVNFPWWDKQLLHMRLDGVDYYVGNKPQWYPYHRRPHYIRMARLSLAAGPHTLELFGEGSQYGTVLTRIIVCSQFVDEFYAGEASFTLRPRQFLDVNRQPAWPYQNKFKVTLEVLRRPPDHATIWYDDFRDWAAGALPSSYYRVVSGSWSVSKDPNDTSSRPYSWVTGSGEFRINYAGFTDVSVRANVKLNANGRAGVVFGSLWWCVNTSTGRLELYQGTSLVGSYNAGVGVGKTYSIRMRIRGSEAACYFGNNKALTATITNPGASDFGIKSDASMTTDLLVAGDSYWYMPQEAVEVTLPGGAKQVLGRIPRTGVTWDSYWGFFRLDTGEEYNTRSDGPDGMPKDISTEWDFLHSQVFTLAGPGDYPVNVKMLDVGVWLSRVYLGDADGFSIVYFPDAETILRLADIAAYDYGVRGVGMWNIGQEDPQLWTMLVDHAPPKV